ncbi:MAG: Cof-type HAD-IIB family hydrolase [Firmicutes bacterium]|nr:Cof-type HAD-IIB family hydrolase [Bacillota bacterium]
MEKYAVFIDIDGTLADMDGVNPKNKDAIKKAREKGHYIFINTARARSYTRPDLWGNIEFDGVVSGIGSNIEVSGKTVFEKYIEKNVVHECVKHFFNTKNGFLVSGAEKGFILNPTHAFEGWDFGKIENPEDFLDINNDLKIQKIEIFGETISDGDKAFLEKRLALYDHGKYIECGRRDCTKASGMDVALKYLGIEKKNSIVIGDSVNDMDMLKNAGIAVAVGNAVDAVKSIADFVSTDCGDGGVAYAIEELLLK